MSRGKKVTREKYQSIKELLTLGVMGTRIAEREGLSTGTVSKIKKSVSYEQFSGITPKPKEIKQPELYEQETAIEALELLKQINEGVKEMGRLLRNIEDGQPAKPENVHTGWRRWNGL